MGFFQTSGILNRRGFFGGAAKAFSPKDIAGLQLWLDATTGLFDATSGGSAVTTDGSSVARWEDQSGNQNHLTQNNSGDRPKLKTSIQNSKNIVRFDGAGDFMDKSALFTSQPYTLFLVFAFTSGGRILSGISNNWLFGSWNNYSNRAFNGAWVFQGTSSSTTFQVATLKCNGSGAKYYQNSTELGSNLNTGAPNGLRFGKGGSGASDFPTTGETAAGDVCEFLGYNQDLTTANLTSIHDYLNSKWSVY